MALPNLHRGEASYRLNAGAERRPGRIGELQVTHPDILLLPEEVRRKALLRDPPVDLVFHLGHELSVELDVLLPLLLHLRFPRREEARDVLKSRVSLYCKLSRDTGAIVRTGEKKGRRAGKWASYFTCVRRSIDSAFRRTTMSVSTSSTRRPYATVTITDAAYRSRCFRYLSGVFRRSLINTFDSKL